MNFIDKIMKIIKNDWKINKVDENPKGERLDFISEEDNIIEQQIKEYDVWYSGDSNELENYYMTFNMYGSVKEPIYNQNRRRYFWSLTKDGNGCDIKKVHSGIPRAMINTLVNAIGSVTMSDANPEIDNLIQEIIKKNDLINMINQQQIPYTLVEGWGAFKVNVCKHISDMPIIEYYNANDVRFIYQYGKLVGIIFKDYYKVGNKSYVLIETRKLENIEGVIHSVIDYELYRQSGENDAIKCELSEVPELEHLQGIKIPNYNHILAVPSKFFFNKENKDYGRSIMQGKIDSFDDLDLILSQLSETIKLSTPVEYFPIDMLQRDKDGRTMLPNIFNRKFVKKETYPNGDGTTNDQIQTTQPQLNFNQYHEAIIQKIDLILAGELSPATLGINIAKKDNAEAQREKEKITIMTRNNIIDRCILIYKELMSICLAVKEYLDTDRITIQDYDINVEFDEFANPSFENQLQILGTAFSNNQLSTEKYVNLLWGDKLSDEEKAKEIAWLEEKNKEDNLGLGDFENENAIGDNL